MTHASDEILSAMLDDEAPTSEEVAHVEECAACSDRMEQLRAVTVALREPLPMPAAHLREAAVAVAVDEASRRGVVRRLRNARNAAAPAATPRRRVSFASAAAALVVALAVGGWALSQVGESGRSPNANRAGVNGRTNSAATAGATGPGTGDGYDAGEIGAFTAVAEVGERLRRDMSQPQDVRAAHALAQAPPCRLPDGRTPVWHATLTFNGVPAYGRARWATNSSWALEVLRQTDCVLLARRTLAPTTPR